MREHLHLLTFFNFSRHRIGNDCPLNSAANLAKRWPSDWFLLTKKLFKLNQMNCLYFITYNTFQLSLLGPNVITPRQKKNEIQIEIETKFLKMHFNAKEINPIPKSICLPFWKGSHSYYELNSHGYEKCIRHLTENQDITFRVQFLAMPVIFQPWIAKKLARHSQTG